LMEAGKKSDVNAARKVLCKSDLARGIAAELSRSGRILTYTIGSTAKHNGITTVRLTSSSTRSPARSQQDVPVVKEGKSWKVCFTQAVSATVPGGASSATSGPPTDMPTDTGAPSDTGLPSGLPSGINVCAAAADALATAEAYVGSAEIGLAEFAQSCVYQNSVPLSVTKSLDGTLFIPPTSTDRNAGEFAFTPVSGGSATKVKVTKEPDGHYYVTGVETG
jgi:hypothetical protein